MKLRVQGLRPAHIQAGLVSESDVEQEFEIVVRVGPDARAFLFSTLIVQEGEERVFVGVVGVAKPEDGLDLESLSEEQLIEVIKEAEIEHVLYDTAAMVARQVSATLMYDLTVPTQTIPSKIVVSSDTRDKQAED